MAELDILKLLPNIKRRLDNRILGTFIGPHLQLPSMLILNPFYTGKKRTYRKVGPVAVRGSQILMMTHLLAS